MAALARRWAPLFAVGLPALFAIALGLLRLAAPAHAGAAEFTRGMTVDVACSLVAVGAALLAGYMRTPASRRARLVLGALVALIGLAGIARGGAADAMTAPAGVAFMVVAVLLATFDRPRGRASALAVQVAIGLVLAMGLISLISRDVALESVISWYRWVHLRPLTATGLIAIGIALLALVARSGWYHRIYARREDEKILVLVLGILSLVLVATGAVAFVDMQRNLERGFNRVLAATVTHRATILDAVLANRVSRANIVSTRPGVAAAMRDWNGRREPQARERLREEGESLLTSGFTSLSFRDPSGGEIARAGEPAADALLEAPLARQPAATRAALAWTNTYLLRTRIAVTDRGQVVGEIEAEQPLDLVGRLQFDRPELGETAQWVLCAPRGETRMACFPHRLGMKVEEFDRRSGAVSRPMDLALAGGTGLAVGPDYRDAHVVAGYAAIGFTGLGVVLKIDHEELYAPLQQELRQWWRWYLAVAILGALLVSSQVRPVAQELVQSERLSRERSEVLARSERALRELYASLADGIVVLGADGTIEFANPAAERLFGYAAQELVGRPVALLIPEELQESNAKATQRFMASGTSTLVGKRNLVFPAVRRDGTRFDLEFSLAPMRQGEQTHLVAVLRDVSQRTALERMKSEFIATVSHELRTPLTSIMGSLELLLEDGTALQGRDREMLEMAWRNSQRLARLVNDVIDAERIESGALRFAPSRFALADFLRDAVRLDQGYAAAHGVTLRLEEPVPAASLELDRDRLVQVMGNLVSNAAKFSPAGSEVTIRARVDAGRARVEVLDRGRGIPEEFRARVFEKFAQADASDEREKGGTGLGLAICRAILERMGGRIGFDDREGGGTVFWFEVPVAG